MADSTSEPHNNSDKQLPTQAKLPAGWLSEWPWITFLLPFIVFMVATSFEPTPPPPLETKEIIAEPDIGFFAEDPGEGFLPAISYSYYPHVYTAKIALTLLAMLLVWPGYRTFPFRVSSLSVLVGVVGVVLWIVLCHLRLEPKVIGPIDEFLGSFIPGLEEGDTPSVGLMSLIGAGERSSFNPLVQMAATPLWAYAFLAIRFLGLALVVPVIEEFFLRGFMMRFVVHDQWWQVPFGAVNRMAVIAGTAVPMLMHPGELLAAFVWFSMVTWLMVRTKNIWDCVVAHGVTNLLLGIYVVWSGEWQLM
ncbi:MAG: CAAX prenyl protease-related protein [Planctomycetes bacterium]|nr:CAAX prenyl protease-related protein [Planctomycetota bacterium]